MRFMDKDLLSVQEARILAEQAGEAKKILSGIRQKKLDEILLAMLGAVEKHLEILSRMAVQETGYGIWQDQQRKSQFLCRQLSRKLTEMKCVGILRQDEQEQLVEIGVPLGAAAAICPVFSPVSMVVNTAALAVKSGNAVIFSPHPRAAKVTARTVEILAAAAEKAGFPKGGISCIQTVTREGTAELLRAAAISVVLDGGDPEPLETIYKSGKPLIYGGIAPSPVFIEKSADIRRAAADIVESRSFDCGICAGTEQYVVADREIAEKAKEELIRCGAYFMKPEEEEKLAELMGLLKGTIDPECLGKPASWLAVKAGFQIPEKTKVLVSQKSYISGYHPYVKGLLSPVLVFYIEDDWMHACEKCMKLLVQESHGNTLVIHSNDEQVIHQFMMKKPVGRVLINAPAAFGAMGAATNLFPAANLGSITAGMGITADNVSPMNLIYIRKAAYGVRDWSLREDSLVISSHVESSTENSLTEQDPAAIGTADSSLAGMNGFPDAARLLKMVLEYLEKENECTK